ncbi:MAG: hypothetical protein HW421_367 [Ignavibacteria bacterium]|nr:hypothetical protein [Ignavibacteria bacterium]
MRKTGFNIILSFYFLLVIGCTESPVSSNGNNYIDFSAPQIGQQSRFIHIIGENINDSLLRRIRYSPDTLIMQITGLEYGGYWLQEKLSELSRLNDSIFTIISPKTTFTYKFIVLRDTLFYYKPKQYYFESHLFNQRIDTNKFFPLNDFAGIKGNYNALIPYMNTNNKLQTGYLSDFTINGRKYSRANVINDYRPCEFDSLGYSYIFSKNHGVIRFLWFSQKASRCEGWELL